ncbi:MAG: ferredoxin [Candidatus Pacebacteria bacterium]|nr:ferredoxin [Candidatus Paceibacterota bacterium]
MIKITLDKSKCIGCGTCWALCEKYFQEGQDNKSHLAGVKEQAQEELEVAEIGCAENAATACPVQCITVK